MTNKKAKKHAASDRAFTSIMREFQDTDNDYQIGEISLEEAISKVEGLCLEFNEEHVTKVWVQGRS